MSTLGRVVNITEGEPVSLTVEKCCNLRFRNNFFIKSYNIFII